MLELNNVSVGEVYSTLNPEILKIIKDNNIKSVQELVDIMPKYSNVDWSNVEKDLVWLNRAMKFAQKKGKEPVIFDYKEYSDKSLEHTDSLNGGNALLLSTPTTLKNMSLDRINNLSIASIKKFLKLTDFYGENYLISKAKKIGYKDMPSLLSALNMYTDQVEKQAKLTDKRDGNLFTYEKDEKKEIVLDNYASVISYLIENTREFVWGELSIPQKKLLLSSIINSKQVDKIIKERMVDIVANYTTLPELDELSNGNNKVLNRFIRK